MKILGLNDKMPFGKYKDKTIKDLIETYHYLDSHANYLNWAINNWKDVKFSNEVIDKLNKHFAETKQTSNTNSNYFSSSNEEKMIEMFGICGPDWIF